MSLSDFKEQISDDFQSTFTIVNDYTLTNLLGMENDFITLTDIIRKYIPDAHVVYTKTNQIPGEYDIYLIEAK